MSKPGPPGQKTLRWRGRPIEEYSKDELIEIVRLLGDQLRATQTAAIENIRFFAKA